MAPFWSNALEYFTPAEVDQATLEPNTFPPLGSGKLPRPAMLVIPDFEPPPPTPTPTPVVVFKQAPPRKAPAKVQKQPSAASTERRRRLRIWDVMPDPPQPLELETRLRDSHGAAESNRAGCPEEVCSPGAADVLQRILGYDSRAPASEAPRGRARHYQEVTCGLDLSFVWWALVELVSSADPDEARLAAPGCRCIEAPPAKGTNNSNTASDLGPCSPMLNTKAQGAALKPSLSSQTSSSSLVGLGKGFGPSPMSVFSPWGTARSSSTSTPECLLAFLGRDPSPLRL